MRFRILILAALVLNGCALLTPAEPTEEERYANDPVGRAALALRQQRSPASAPTERFSAQKELSSPPRSLTLGMSPSRVRELWGQPQEVENAGDPASGNERWIYLNGISRNWGTSDCRVVYFEQNQVVGWENRR